MRQPLFLILGHSGSGKDVTASVLESYGFQYAGPTSNPLIHLLIEHYKAFVGCETSLEFPHPQLSAELKDLMDNWRNTLFDYFDICLDEVSCPQKFINSAQTKRLQEVDLNNLFTTCYDNRHSIKDFIFKFGQQLRKERGNLFLVEELFSQGTNIIVGLREREEVREAIQSYDWHSVMWVHNYRVPKDPTMEYTLEDVLSFTSEYSRPLVLMDNGGTLLQFHRRVINYIDLILEDFNEAAIS